MRFAVEFMIMVKEGKHCDACGTRVEDSSYVRASLTKLEDLREFVMRFKDLPGSRELLSVRNLEE